MKYFKLIRSGIDVAPLLEEVSLQEQAWLLNTSRQDKIRVQRDTNTIFISGPVARPDLNVNENQESKLTAVSELFPRAVAFMTGVAMEMNSQLSRATIVRLKPKSRVSRHIDIGSYYLIRDRFHLVLYSSAGSVLMSGGEQVRMQEGELWWFDNKQYHEAHNESHEWRVHYIFDLLPAAHGHLAVNGVFLPPEPAAESKPDKPPGDRSAAPPTLDLLSSAIRERAIVRGENQRLISPKGVSNSWLIDLRRLFMDAKLLDDQSRGARHACEWLHRSQGAQDARYGRLNRGSANRRAHCRCRRYPQLGKQPGKSSRDSRRGEENDCFRLRADRLP